MGQLARGGAASAGGGFSGDGDGGADRYWDSTYSAAIGLLYLFVVWQLAREGRVWVLVCLIGIAAVETAAVHPDYLSYFNVAAGGPGNGEKFAADSNLDWGQDVLRMSKWIKNNAADRPYAARLSGQRNKPLLAELGLNPGRWRRRCMAGCCLSVRMRGCWIDGCRG